MKVYCSRPSGFCFGGKRSVDMAYALGNCFSLGKLLHNEQLIEKLQKDGITPASFDEIIQKKPCKVVIRAHGVPLEQIEALKEKGFDVADATCPNVRAVYDIAMKHENSGYSILIFGDKNHPEIVGLLSRLKNPIVFSSVPASVPSKACLVSQTTMIKKEYDAVKEMIKGRCKEFIAFDTICSATEERQAAASSLASKVDVMVVIGGKDSSNTKKLFEVCSAVNEKAYMIQTAADLKKSWFEGAESAGITAGASTPDFAINSVFDKINSYQNALKKV